MQVRKERKPRSYISKNCDECCNYNTLINLEPCDSCWNVGRDGADNFNVPYVAFGDLPLTETSILEMRIEHFENLVLDLINKEQK